MKKNIKLSKIAINYNKWSGVRCIILLFAFVFIITVTLHEFKYTITYKINSSDFKYNKDITNVCYKCIRIS